MGAIIYIMEGGNESSYQLSEGPMAMQQAVGEVSLEPKSVTP